MARVCPPHLQNQASKLSWALDLEMTGSGCHPTGRYLAIHMSFEMKGSSYQMLKERGAQNCSHQFALFHVTD